MFCIVEEEKWFHSFFISIDVVILLKTRAFEMNLVASSNEHFVHLFVSHNFILFVAFFPSFPDE